jgi:hypothetical protein
MPPLWHDPEKECAPDRHEYGPWSKAESCGDGTFVQAHLCRTCLRVDWQRLDPRPFPEDTAISAMEPRQESA